jgi:catechol 2,3-dioxygenase-like lactoylglutathione lyase family enzyme
MRIDHINIAAPRALLEDLREFYCAVFGLETGFRPDFPQAGYWLYAADRPLVHLSLGSERDVGQGRGHLDHVAFRASGLRDFLSRLAASAVDYRSSHVAELELTQLFFTDPAGTGLEVNFVGEDLP